MSLKVYILRTLKLIFFQAVLTDSIVYQMLVVYTNVVVKSAVV